MNLDHVGALPKPTVPPGPVGALFDELHRLHHLAGWPSLREMAKQIGCSHTTVSAAFSEPRIPRWGLLELIVETLGGDTGQFHRLWLASSTALPVAAPGPPALATRPPRQLPADVAAFTGRADQLAALDALLDRTDSGVVIATLSGTAGVGKTALAVHWAQRVAHRFPDGELYIDLRGYDLERPVTAAEGLEVLLRALGVDGAAVPHELPERAARYRTLLADRRMLILLDNAHSVSQVRDLLPGASSCLVLVTSREMLAALVARHGAVRLNLDLLPMPESTALLRALVGSRVDSEPDAARALAERCARLPLALRVAAELAAARPHVSLARLVAELDAEPRRLDMLTAGDDDSTAVRTVLSWSHRHLSTEAAQAFRMIGLHPGRDIDAHAAAALAGLQPGRARKLLDGLARAHLIEESGPGRYAMHDLLRAYAAELASELPAPDQQAALDRLCDHYRSAAAGADQAWLDAEWRNLVACAASAAATRPGHTRDIATSIAGYLDMRARYRDALDLHELARRTAVDAGDRAAEGTALANLANINERLGRYQDAIEHQRTALAAYQEAGHRAGEARALHGIGTLLWRLGRYAEAHEHLRTAVDLYREVGERAGESSALSGLGIACRRLGRYAEAERHQLNAIAVSAEIGDRGGEARARNNLGLVCILLGRHTEAMDHLTRSRTIARKLGNRLGQAVALDNLATAYRLTGRCTEALEHDREALEIYLEIGHRAGQGEALRGLGVALSCLGQHQDAVDHLDRALAMARTLGEAEGETAALTDLGDVQRAMARTTEAAPNYRAAVALAEEAGDRYELARALAGMWRLTGARGHWQRAVTLYEELGLPEADELRGEIVTS